MVFGFLTDIALEFSFWSTKQLYNTTYWLIWGHRYSPEEKLILKQNKELKIISEQLLMLNERLDKLENKPENIADTYVIVQEEYSEELSPL